MMTAEELARLREKFEIPIGSTHYANCHFAHPRCALHNALDEIELLQAALQKIQDAAWDVCPR